MSEPEPTQEQMEADRDAKASSMLHALKAMIANGVDESRMKAHLMTLYYDGLLDSDAWSSGYDAGWLDYEEKAQYTETSASPVVKAVTPPKEGE